MGFRYGKHLYGRHLYSRYFGWWDVTACDNDAWTLTERPAQVWVRTDPATGTWSRDT